MYSDISMQCITQNIKIQFLMGDPGQGKTVWYMQKTVEGSNSDIRLEHESMSVKIPLSSLTVCGTLNM